MHGESGRSHNGSIYRYYNKSGWKSSIQLGFFPSLA